MQPIDGSRWFTVVQLLNHPHQRGPQKTHKRFQSLAPALDYFERTTLEPQTLRADLVMEQALPLKTHSKGTIV